MMKTHQAIATAVAAAALLFVGGCTAAAPAPGPSTSAGAPATASTTSTASAPSPTSPAPAPATPPADYTMVTAAANMIQVPLPSGLEVLDPSQIDVSADMQQTFDDMAQKLGMTPDDLKQQLANLDLYAIDGDSNNVNILQPQPGVGTTLAQVQPTLENIGATGITARQAMCPTGPVLVVTYTLTENDVTMAQTQLYVQTDTMTTTVITITGVTWTADQVTQIADVMLASLQHV